MSHLDDEGVCWHLLFVRGKFDWDFSYGRRVLRSGWVG